MKPSHSLPAPAAHPTGHILTLFQDWGAAELHLFHLPKATSSRSIRSVCTFLNSPCVAGPAERWLPAEEKAHSENAVTFRKREVGTGSHNPGNEPWRATSIISNNQHRSQPCRRGQAEEPAWKSPACFEGKMRVKLTLERTWWCFLGILIGSWSVEPDPESWSLESNPAAGLNAAEAPCGPSD